MEYNANILTLQHDINQIVNIAKSWGLSFAPSKCVIMRFSRMLSEAPPPADLFISGAPIIRTTSHKDLGIIVDSSLKFHLHVEAVSTKANGLAQNLLRSTLNRSEGFMKILFTSHIRPLLEFSSSLWNTGFAHDLTVLESVQRRWTKQINGLQDISYHDRLKHLSLYSTKGRLLRQDLIQIWKISI